METPMKNGMTQWIAMFSVLIVVLGLASCSKGPTDESISEAIKAKYYADPQLMNDRVEISVANGEVTLKGEVSSDAARLQAYKLANETAGVRRVNDTMQVRTPALAAVTEQSGRQESVPAPAPAGPPTRTVETQRTRKSSPPSVTSDSRTSETPQTPVSAPAKPLEIPSTPPSSPPPPPAPRKVRIPAGTPIRIQMV